MKKMEPDTMNKVDLDHSQGGRSVLVDIFAVVGVFGVSDAANPAPQIESYLKWVNVS